MKVIKNPDDPSQTYTIGQRGRKPLWYLRLIGQATPPRPPTAKALKPKPAERTGKTRLLTNGSFMVNGQFYYASEDASIEVDEGDEVRVICQG